MGDGANIQELQKEIDAVSKQMQKVEANSKAVESAIVVEGTFRGYRGEDLFLKHNLGTVQEEMMKQLMRKQKRLNIRRRELLGHCGSGSATAVGGELAPNTNQRLPYVSYSTVTSGYHWYITPIGNKLYINPPNSYN